MIYHVRILNENRLIETAGGEKLLHLLRDAGFPEMFCKEYEVLIW